MALDRDYDERIEGERIRGVAIKGTITTNGVVKEFYIKLPIPAMHSDLRDSFFSEYGKWAPMPPSLTEKEYVKDDIVVTYGFYSNDVPFMNRWKAGAIAYACGQTKYRRQLLTSNELIPEKSKK